MKKIRNIFVAAALAGAALAAAAGAAHAAVIPPGLGPWIPPMPATAIATTHITNDPDSGHGIPPDWATDTIGRTVSVTLTGQVPGTDCGLAADAGCWSFAASLNDNGSFVTIPGAGTPNQSCAGCAGEHVRSAVRGMLHGTYAITFDASSPAPDAGLVPAAHDDHGVATSPPFTSTAWPELFFPAGTSFGGPAGGAYDWSYVTSGFPAQVWVDSSANGDGDQPGDGNITG